MNPPRANSTVARILAAFLVLCASVHPADFGEAIGRDPGAAASSPDREPPVCRADTAESPIVFRPELRLRAAAERLDLAPRIAGCGEPCRRSASSENLCVSPPLCAVARHAQCGVLLA